MKETKSEKTPADDSKKTSDIPAPQYITADAFNAGMARLTGMVEGAVRTLAGGERQQQRQQPTIAEPTEDEISELLESGDSKKIAKALKQLKAAGYEEAVRALRPEIDALRTTGTEAIERLVKTQAMQSMPHYIRFKAEIDDFIKTMPAETKLDPDVYLGVYRMVVGSHQEELQAEAIEVALKDPERNPSNVANRGTRQLTESGEEIPTVGEFFGEEAEELLAHYGRDPDDFARKLGYRDHADRVKQLSDFEQPPPPWQLPPGATMKSLRKARLEAASQE